MPPSSKPKPTLAKVETLITVNNKGSIIGKLKTAIKVVLLLVLDAIAATKVKTVAIPMLPNNNPEMNKPVPSMGFPINKLKKV